MYNYYSNNNDKNITYILNKIRILLSTNFLFSIILLFNACDNGINTAPNINTNFQNISLNENNGTTNYQLQVNDINGDELNVNIESNNTSIITVNKNFINPLLQADYTNKILDFNLTTISDSFGIVKITITVDDNDKNVSKSFEINVKKPPYVFNIGKLATGQTITYKEFDDGNTTRGTARSYTRDDNKSVVIDNITKLMWQDDNEVKTVIKTWEDAKIYCNNLSLSGFTDWYLPTIEEFMSISDKSRNTPSINEIFINVSNYSSYWSSTTNIVNNARAWYFTYSLDNSNTDDKQSNYYIRCVREINN